MIMVEMRERRPKIAESEKITINLGHVDLGQIDLLVQEGFYANRTDLIRTAIRNQLSRHEEAMRKTVERREIELGVRRYTRADLEAVKSAGERLHIQVLVSPSSPRTCPRNSRTETIASLQVLGALQAPAAVKAALKDRMG